MTWLEKIKKKIISESRFQDVIFIFGLFTFSIILVLGLFPKTEAGQSASRISFIYLMMVIPIIIAIYFIIVSFKRKLYFETSEISTSITFKIALAFVFIAILSSVPILILSNNIINQTMSELINDDTISALEESVKMSNDKIYESHHDIKNELKSIYLSLIRRTINIRSTKDRFYISKTNELKGFQTIFFRVSKKDLEGNELSILKEGHFGDSFTNTIIKFLKDTDVREGYKVHNISNDDSSVHLGMLFYKKFLIIVFKEIQPKLYKRIDIYKNLLEEYKSQIFLKPYFQMGTGIVLLVIAIIIIILSMSLGFFLSRNITRPVLELVNAAGNVASGNFNINLKRDSSDELTLLFNSFNQMVHQLDSSKKIMYQTQKLEAYREVAQMLLHEIKNPLTPIKLSAERIKKRYFNKTGDIDKVINTGTETIIEEVKVLTMMLNEFSQFAKLPEMKGEIQDLNSIIGNCYTSFLGHDRVKIDINLDNSIPNIFIDKHLMKQALTNIIQNAIEAIKETGNISITSKLINEGQKKFARIIIKDDGIGIDEKNIDKIFEPSFSTKESGSGIGLAMVQKIILEHNGDIICNSTNGEGTEFIIDIPIYEDEVDQIGKDTGS